MPYCEEYFRKVAAVSSNRFIDVAEVASFSITVDAIYFWMRAFPKAVP